MIVLFLNNVSEAVDLISNHVKFVYYRLCEQFGPIALSLSLHGYD